MKTTDFQQKETKGTKTPHPGPLPAGEGVELRPLANRDAAAGKYALPTDGWYHVSPRGEFPHGDSKLTQVVDDAALAAMVNRFQQDAAKPNFPGIRVDYDHFSYDTEKSSEAAGWIHGLQNRADGLYAQIQWTAGGKTKVEDGTFRLVSPTWLPTEVEKLGNRRIRPLRLDSVALTNNPNLKGMTPLSNRAEAEALADNQQQQRKGKTMKTVCTALGLSADASEEATLAEVTKLRNRADTAEAELAPIKNKVKDLEAAQVEADLVKYANRIKPEKKEAFKQMLLTNRAMAVELLESMAETKPATTTTTTSTTGRRPLHNRAEATVPETKSDETGDVEKATAITNRARELRDTNPKRDFESCWNQAMNEQAAK